MKPIMTSSCVLAAMFMAIAATPAGAGTNVNETTGAILCKGSKSCGSLKAKCNGTYTDATDSNGTPYGKCQPASKGATRGIQSLTAPTMQPPPQRRGLKAY